MLAPLLQRVLIFHNPGFEADLAALVAAVPPGVSLRTFSTEEIGRHFLRLFPTEVLGLDLSLFHEDRYRRRREQWARRARLLVRDLYASFAFDAALAPADDTPYWREIALAIEELGVPFVVLFKETTHPPGQLRTVAPVIRRYVPVTARQVIVNSKRTAEYMIACGADPARTFVVGQPRFDRYAALALKHAAPGEGRRFLFLTYEFDAYRPFDVRERRARHVHEFLRRTDASLPERLPKPVDETWLGLRCETEAGLIAAAAKTGGSIVVKPHRQMDPIDLAFDQRFVNARASAAGVRLRYAAATEDVAALLAASDVVVGFQTTVLLEAMALGRDVVYAAWGEDLDERDDELIPFAEWGDVIRVARSSADLQRDLGAAPGDAARTARAQALAEEWLGTLDGHAAERVWALLARFRHERRPSPTETDLARSVVARSTARRDADVANARMREIVWAAVASLTRALAALPVARRGGRWIEAAASRARERRLEREGRGQAVELAGPFEAPLAVELADTVRLALRRALSARR